MISPNLNLTPPRLIGIFRGEGSGPEVIQAACCVLNAVAERSGIVLQIEADESIQISAPAADFCEDIFARGGAIMAGAVGGRFVYDLRRRFQLYYKLNPLRSFPELKDACRLKMSAEPIDILVVRENLGGIYQGESVDNSAGDGREILHTFVQSEGQVRAVLEVAAHAARKRRGSLTVVGKQSGLPLIHSLWREGALEICEALGVEVGFLEIDYAAYKLLQEPEAFDVIVAPNCFGDILSDLGGLLAGARGLTFGASYSAEDAAVYQTNHGAAHDLAGADTANPVGQIFSAAMMLRESFRLEDEAQWIEDAVRTVWRAGWRTADLAERGCRIAGTREFACLVAAEICRTAIPYREACSAVG